MKHSGFTTLELVVVLLIVGILAASLLPRSTDRRISIGASADQLANDIRYVQSLAMTQGKRSGINLTATTYAFYYVSGAVAVSQVHPATGSTTPISLASGVTMTIPPANLANSLIAFDGRGIPYTDSLATTLLAANAVITLTGAGGSNTVTILPQTGKVTP